MVSGVQRESEVQPYTAQLSDYRAPLSKINYQHALGICP